MSSSRADPDPPAGPPAPAPQPTGSPARPAGEPAPPPRSNTVTIAHNSAWTLADNLLSLSSQLVCSIAVGRVMGPSKLGYYNYVLWVAGMTGMIASLGVPLATRTFAAELVGRGEYDLARAVIRATLRFQCYVAAAVGLVGAATVFAVVSPERRVWALLAVVSVAPTLLNGVTASAITATEDVRLNVRASVVATLTNLLGVATSLVLGWGLVGLTASLLASRVVDLSLRQRFYRQLYERFPVRNPDVALSPELRRRLVKFCWQSTMLLALSVVVWDRSEVFFLERFCDIRQVAFYSLSFGIVQSLLVGPRVLSWSTDTTILAERGRAPERVGELAVTAMRFIALISIPVLFGASAIAEPVIRLAYGAAYLPAIPVFATMSLLALGLALRSPAERVLVAMEKQGFLLGWGAVMAAVNVGADLLVIPRHGALGAAWVKGGVQILAAAGVWFHARRELGLRLPWARLAGVLGAGIAMFVGVRQLVAAVAVPEGAAAGGAGRAVLALAVGVPAGAALFALMLRVTRSLDRSDRARLLALTRMVPPPGRRAYGALVDLVAGDRAGASPAR